MGELPDIESLIKPIPGDDPGGIPLLYEGTHDLMLEARRDEDSGLPRGSWERPLKTASWSKVIEIGTSTLIEKSKDLRVAAILSESLIRRHGFEGFNTGVALLTALLENCWDDLHPRVVDDDDIESRSLILEWYAQKATMALTLQNITAPTSSEKYNFSEWLNVEKLIRLYEGMTRKERERAERTAPAKPSIEGYDNSFAETPTEWLEANKQYLEDGTRLLLKLDEVISQKMTSYAPNLSPLKNTLNNVATKLTGMHQNRMSSEMELIQSEPVHQEHDAPINDSNDTKDTPILEKKNNISAAKKQLNQTANIGSRDEAYDLLKKITEYLMRADPHSPTPYLLRRAVSFRNMTFADMITMFVDDEWQRTNLLKLMGANDSEDITSEKKE